jgi:MFS family permease
VTVVFAAYVLSLLVALLTTGALSDHVGRRPTVPGALMLNSIAMVMFITAGSGAALIAARTVQGFATGVATAALGAAILDVDRRRGAVLNSVTVFAGLTAGTLGAATLVTFAPDPTQLVYVVLLPGLRVREWQSQGASLEGARGLDLGKGRSCFARVISRPRPEDCCALR